MATSVGKDYRPTFSESIAAYFSLWRYSATQVVLSFCAMYLGWICLAGGLELPLRQAVGKDAVALLSNLCALIAVYLINDAADAEIDRLVHPERPIPQGRSAARHVFLLGALLLGLGVLLAPLVNLRFMFAMLVLASLTVGHYGYLKHRLKVPCSSEIITPAVSVLFPVTAFMIAPTVRLNMLLLIAGFIYCADLAHDLLGGIHDQQGDRSLNVSTFAIYFGDRATLTISFTLFLMSVVMGWLVYARGQLGWIYLATFMVLAALMLRQYVKVFLAGEGTIHEAAGKANHFGGFYFFIVSASILPDIFSRHTDKVASLLW